MLRHLSLRVPAFKRLDYAAHNLKYLMLPNVIGYHRSVRLYTDGCVVNSGTGLMGPCSPPFAVWNFDTCIEVQLSMIAGEYTRSSNLA